MFDHIQSKDALRLLEGDSPEAIDNMRKKSSVYYARIGFELAKAKNHIQRQYLIIRLRKESVASSEKQAQQDYDNQNEVSYNEMKYLYEAIDKSMNACAPGANQIRVMNDRKPFS